VSITPQVPQPDISSQLGQSGGPAQSGGSSGEPFDPESGNYSTSATDGAVAVPGPALQISRTYNSLNPASIGAFGTGWSSNLDTAVTPDSDGSGNVVVTMPDGSQARFGYKGTGSNGVAQYAPPMGSPDVLTHNANSTWTLGISGGSQYDFTSGGVLSQITSPTGLTQTFTDNAAGEPVTIKDTYSGRTLSLTWGTPAGGLYPHVTSVTTNAPGTGQSGLAWTYSYSDDNLTQVCAPTGGCTGYTNGTTSSHYATAVMDSGPRSYYRIGDPAGSTAATDSVDDNLGSTAGTYSNVTLGAAGPLAGTSATAGSFNGSSSDVSLASNLVSDSTNVTIELWFKDTGDGGVLFSYDAEPITTAASTADNDPHVPALYVGGNGKLYGELWNGSTDPMNSAVAVNDGNWHYAVLSGSATTQSLYLDGNLVGTLSGQISQVGAIYNTVGAGFWAGWPEAISATSPTLTTDPYGHFTGSIGEVAIYPHALGQPAVTTHYHLASLASPEMTQVTLPSARTAAQVSYDTVNDRVTSYTGPSGGTWQIAAPSASGYISSSEGLASVTRYVTVTTPTGYQEVYGYDAVNGGRLTSYTPGKGDAPRTFGYDQGGFLNAMTDADGNLVTFTNDAYGNVLSRTWSEVEPAVVAGPRTQSADAAASGGCCTTYYTYYENAANLLDPRNGQVTGVADARSASATDTTYLTSYAYNAAGELTSSTTPPTSGYSSGRTTNYGYSTSSTTAYGGGTTPPGLLLSQTTPNEAVTSYSYYSDGDLAQQTQPNGARTVYTYDGLGRALSSDTYSDTYPSGLTTSYSYNAVNQPLKVTYPGVVNKVTGVTHTQQDAYTYDADSNLLSQTESDLTGSDPARTTADTYNDNGELVSVTGPAGATTGGSAQSQGASSANPAGTTVGYTYDAAGNVATMVDGDGNQYDYTYNEYNEPTQVTLTSNSTSSSSSAATCAPGQTPNPDGSCALVLDSYAYDPAGLLAATTDAMGRITNDFYDGNQDLIATQVQPPPATSGSAPPPGRQTAYTYGAAGNLTSQAVSNLPVTTADTTTTNWVYNAAGQVSSQTVDAPPSGTSSGSYSDRTTSYTYNPDNLVTAQTVGGTTGSTTTTSAYNTADDMTSQTVQDGSVNDTTSWTYDQLGQRTSMITPDGNASGATPANYTTNYAYDQAGNLSRVTGPPVATSSYAAQTPATTRPVTDYGYDTFGDQTQAQNPDGNVATTAYDGDGQVTAVTQPSYTPPGSSTAITATAKYGYDGNGNLTAETDQAGNTTSYAYDALGDLITQTDPQLTGQSAAGVWSYTYDSDGEQLSSASPTGAQTQATYDYFGDLATSTQDVRSSSGTAYDTTSYAYDYLGDPLTTKTPDGAVTTDTYDHLSELTSAANDVGDVTSYSYNYLGLPSRTTNPDQSFTTLGYDPAGNLTSAQEYGIPPAPPAVGSPVSTQSYGYDQDGNQTSAQDGNGRTTTFGYNAADEVTSEVQPVSASASDTTKYTYDPAGNQTSSTGGRGNPTWTTYNSWDLPESVIEPATAQATTAAQRTWTTAYNADGQAARVTQPGGITISYGYDQMGDLSSQSGSGASAPSTAQSFGYDTDGDLTSATAPAGTDQFTYNDAGDLTAASGPSGTASFGYNGDGLMTSRADKAGTTSYTYDTADRLATVADPLTGTALTYGYNPDSLPTTISYAKGGTAGPKQALGYTGLQQLNSDKLTSASGATIASASYTYDADGNLATQATTGFAGSASTAYGYNQADELTSSAVTGGTTTNYGYDADGDLTSAGGTSYTYNAQDQPTAAVNGSSTTSYAYTLSGALATVTPPSGSTQNYTSNAYGQAVTAPGGVTYAYDGLGRLATRTSGSTTTSLAYSGSDNTVANDGTTSYTYDPSGGPVAEQASGGTAAAALTNVHGDVAGTFSPASGTSSLAASAAYSPYGSVTASSGSMPALGYQDQYTDPSTGDTDMSARWYAPSTGTFTSSDSTSTGMPDPSVLSPTPYGYVSGNPLANTDPTGHFCILCVVKKVVRVSCDLDPYCLLGQALSGHDGLLSGETAGGCEDEICGGHSGAGHQCLEFGKCYTGGYSSGGGGGRGGGSGGYSCGFYCGVGVGIGIGVAVCSYEPEICASEVEAEAPPPPPPPQDCYAGPDPGCSPPSPPEWLKDDQYEADKPSETTNPKNISAKDTITGEPQTSEEYLEQHEAEVKNLQQELASENSGAETGNGSGDDSLTRDAGNRAGKPETPQPGPDGANPSAGGEGGEGGSPSAGGEGGAGGGGNPPATTPDFPEPPDEPSDITTKVVDRNGYREVTNSSAGPEFIYDNSGADFEAWQQQTLNDIASGNSGSSAASEGPVIESGPGASSPADVVNQALDRGGMPRVNPYEDGTSTQPGVAQDVRNTAQVERDMQQAQYGGTKNGTWFELVMRLISYGWAITHP
jgi:RHS repeat-associated protein